VAGLGSLWGLVVGAAFVALIPTVSQSAPLIGKLHEHNDVAFGIVVILMMLLLPTGVAGLLHRAALTVEARRRRTKGGISAPEAR
jgi:ABC-type branched-subunit amino acid transport system permease subunit